MNFLLFMLAVFPLLVFLFLLLVTKKSLLVSAWMAFLVTFLLAISVWGLPVLSLYFPFAKGATVAFDIFTIIAGAIFFLEVVKEERIIENLVIYLEEISSDIRVKVIFLAWFLENFIEGIAGFGTPGAIVAPLLLGLGLSPIKAVTLALIGNSTAVVFGAAGTPIRVGFSGFAGQQIAINSAFLNITGSLVPVFILYFLFAGDKNKRKFTEAIPFALFSGFAFTLSSLPFVYLGMEFPSILGSIAGFLITAGVLRLGLFKPKEEPGLRQEDRRKPSLPLPKVLFPYALVISFLILGKILGGVNPGVAFILSGLIFSLGRKGVLVGAFKEAGKRVIQPVLTIFLMSAVVQMMTFTQFNPSGFPSMIETISLIFRNRLLGFWAPFAGMFGSFLTGSATVSNIMFGEMMAEAASAVKMNLDKILALEVAGAALGNMIALADILAAETVLGMKNKEVEIIKRTIIPCASIVAITAVIGLIWTIGL